MTFGRALGAAIVGASLAASGHAGADERLGNWFALEMGGVKYGVVRTIDGGEKSGGRELVVIAPEVGVALAALVGTFTQGKVVKKDLRLTSGAVMRKGNDARLVGMKLPAVGVGGAADMELSFLVPALTTQPLLTAVKQSPRPPSTEHIASFRLTVSGMSATEAPKLEPIALLQNADGQVTSGDIGFEVGAGAAPPFVAWQKAGKPVPRSVQLEYFGTEGEVVLKLHLDRCAPASVKPMGTSGTTRIVLSCPNLTAG